MVCTVSIWDEVVAVMGAACTTGATRPRLPKVTASATAPRATTPGRMRLSRGDAVLDVAGVPVVPVLAAVLLAPLAGDAVAVSYNPTSTRS